MFCYRRFGHNEGDEPAFTQPLMYRKIRSHPAIVELYSKKLVAEGVLTEAEVEEMKSSWRSKLDAEFDIASNYKPNKADWLDGRWSGLKAVREDQDDPRRGQTGMLGRGPPADRQGAHHGAGGLPRPSHDPALPRQPQEDAGDRRGHRLGHGRGARLRLAAGRGPSRAPLRSGRASAAPSRSATRVLTDQENEERYTNLNHIRENQARYEVINSMLSEEAVLGFEYGYTLSEPNALTLWEAQFGDFANGAQVVFDQFISSGERKWLRMSGLVCLLPHGYEGQGPEHSSARLERLLQMCAEDNMQVAYCSTPSNYFHILRRQLKRDFRKPLILMTPKSLLRHKRCVSHLADIAEGTHRSTACCRTMLKRGREGIKLVKDDKIRRVVICTGKVYFDLLEEREKRGIDDVYLLRVEQLYPFPVKSLAAELARFKKADVVWCQEEPKNMGSWTFVEPYLEWALKTAGAKVDRPRYVGRPASAATATGLMSKHQIQLQAFLDEAFAADRRDRLSSVPTRALQAEPPHKTERRPWQPKSAYPLSANPFQRPPSAAGSRSPATP